MNGGAHGLTGARRILCLRLDTMGDVVMTTPAIRAIRSSARPDHLALLTSPAGAEAAALVPEVDEVLVHAAPWMKARPRRGGRGADLALIERLRAGGFDAAVIFTVYSQSPLPAALTCLLADIPIRLAHCRENPYELLTQWVPEPEPERFVRHEVRRQLDLVAMVGCATDDERLGLSLPARARAVAAALARDHGLGNGPWAVLHPGASAESRRYPPEGFAAAARLLIEAGWRLVFTGATSEVGLVERMRALTARPTASCAGDLTLAELAALIERAPVLISNNTGPVHLAAAVATPVVDLYALTNPQHSPWGVESRVLFSDVPCRWCYKSVCPEGHHRCLQQVAPERVAAAAMDLWREAADPGTMRADGAVQVLDESLPDRRGPADDGAAELLRLAGPPGPL